VGGPARPPPPPPHPNPPTPNPQSPIPNLGYFFLIYNKIINIKI